MDNTDKALIQMTTPNTILYDAINKHLGKTNLHKRDELISEIALSLCKNRKKINVIIDKNEFLYYFIGILRRQIQSSTSSYHKNCRETITSKFGTEAFNMDMVQNNDLNDAEEQEHKENTQHKEELIKIARESLNVNWFDAQIFKMYYDDKLTYREIEKECDIDHCLAWNSVKKTKDKLIKIVNKLNK